MYSGSALQNLRNSTEGLLTVQHLTKNETVMFKFIASKFWKIPETNIQ